MPSNLRVDGRGVAGLDRDVAVVVILLLLMLAPVVLVTVSPVPAPPPATATPKPEAVPGHGGGTGTAGQGRALGRGDADRAGGREAARPAEVPDRRRDELAITLSAAATARENEAPRRSPKAAATEAAPVSTLRDDVSRAATVTAPAVIVSPGRLRRWRRSRGRRSGYGCGPGAGGADATAPAEIATEPATTVALMV